MNCHSFISEFDTLEREEVLQLFAQCIAQLPATQKIVLAMYYHENLQLAEIATALGLTECEIDQMRAKALGALQTKLADQIGLTALPAGFDNVTQTSQGSRQPGAGPEKRCMFRRFRGPFPVGRATGSA